jgi:hypothetical protein
MNHDKFARDWSCGSVLAFRHLCENQNVRRGFLTIAILVGALAASPGQVFAEGPERALARDGAAPEAPPDPRIGFAVLAGLALPACNGQTGSCDGSLGPAGSLQGLVLYEPSATWAFGLAGQLTRLHWQGTYVGMGDGATHAVDSDLTTGFVGLTARFIPLPAWSITPVFQLALGSAFQAQTGSNFGCNDGVIPTGQLALGGRARVSSSVSVFAMASASSGIKGGCVVSDGPPVTPFVAWGYGFHIGAAFDVPLGHSRSEASVAAR